MATMQTLPESTLLNPIQDRRGNTALAVRSLLYAVFKHQRLVLGIFLVTLVGSMTAAMVRPQKWMATAKVLVKLGEHVQLAPAEAPSKSVSMPLHQEVVKTEADIVRSYEVVSEAVRRMGLKAEDGSTQQLIAGLQAGLSVAPTPGTNVLSISFIGKDREKAARFVNTVTDAYIQHHNKVYRREGLNQFYGEQLQLLESQMKDAQEALRQYLRDNAIVDVDQELRLLNQDVIEQDKGLRAHRAKIAATRRKLEQLQSQLAKTPEQVPFAEEYLSNPVLGSFKQKLTDLEVERIRLLERYLPADRHVQDIEEQIANLKQRMTQERTQVLNKQTIRSNSLHGELQRSLMTMESQLADVQAREPALVSRLEASRIRLAELRDKQFAIGNLEQDAEQKRYAFDTYFKRQEEARISEAMTNQSLINVSVLDRAQPPLNPQNGVLLPLLMGIVGGLGLSMAMAVGVEYLNRRLRFEEEVERYLELPVLAVIPELESAGELLGH